MDYQDPDYSAVFEERADRLETLRDDPELLQATKVHYRTHPWKFVNDWGMTFEPRNLELGRVATIPFVTWERQDEYLTWIYRRWLSSGRGLVEKSRDCGVTWLSVGFSVSMWLFLPNFACGFGSRKEEYVDKKGDPDAIFEKIRFFVEHLPTEFLPAGFNINKHSPYMRLINPENGAVIKGEGGDSIGRGGRCSMYFVDEAAHVEHQEKTDAALSATTNCQIDISSVNGNGNLFYRKRMRYDGTERIFIFDWRDDPRKDDIWYQRQVDEQDEVTVAQEIDRDYNASAEGVFIPAKWVAASVDAHVTLGFDPEGIRVLAFDPADVGDARACVRRHGSVLTEAVQKKQGDITDAIPWAFELAEGADVFSYDADGMGAPSMKLALQRKRPERMRVVPYYGSAGVRDPDGTKGDSVAWLKPLAKRVVDLHSGGEKTNQDRYINFRAQTWDDARDRFQATYEAVQRARQGKIVHADPERLISISGECEELRQLQSELSRPKRLPTPNGKIRVESKAEMKKRGVDSPNLADGAIMAISVRRIEESKTETLPETMAVMPDTGVGSGWMSM